MSKSLEQVFHKMRNDGTLEVLVGALIDTTFTYDEAGIDLIEKSLNRIYPEGHVPMPTTYIPFAFILGESIIRAVPGAKWEFPTDNIFDAVVITPVGGSEIRDGTAKILPFTRIQNFWRDRTDGLTVYYRLITMMAMFGPPKQLSEEWMEFPNGDRLRCYAPSKTSEGDDA